MRHIAFLHPLLLCFFCCLLASSAFAADNPALGDHEGSDEPAEPRPIAQPAEGGRKNDATPAGCFKHSVRYPVLEVLKGELEADLTRSSCLATCSRFRFNYFGLLGGRLCYCGVSLRLTATSSSCNLPCPGNPAETCGGPGAMETHRIGRNEFSGVQNEEYNEEEEKHDWSNSKSNSNAGTKPASRAVISSGCFKFSWRHPLLEVNSGLFPDLTRKTCFEQCRQHLFNYFGLYQGNTCYCGVNLSKVKVSTTNCNVACSGNEKETCGGEQDVEIYKILSQEEFWKYKDMRKKNRPAGLIEID